MLNCVKIPNIHTNIETTMYTAKKKKVTQENYIAGEKKV